MKILVLHSDIAPDAPPEEIDTITSAKAVAEALVKHGHEAPLAPFTTDPGRLAALLGHHKADVVFNMVEGVDGLGALAPIAPRMLDAAGVIFTGVDYTAMAVTSDKPLTKRKMREAGIATADWCEPPDWKGLAEKKYIVKSVLEDASVGLDDGCVVFGAEGVRRRAEESALRHGGKWFAEEYIDGREYNISMMEGADGEPIVMPLAEMRFDDWPSDKPRHRRLRRQMGREPGHQRPDDPRLRYREERSGAGRQAEKRLHKGMEAVRLHRLCPGRFPRHAGRRALGA